MKLKTKLKISFLSMVLVPVLLLMIIMGGLGIAKVRAMEKTYDIQFSMNFIVNSIQTISESNRNALVEIQQNVGKDPYVIYGREWLDQINKELKKKLSYLLVLKDGEIYYQGTEDMIAPFIDQFPGFEEEDDLRIRDGTYIGGGVKAMLRQMDVRMPDGENIRVFIVTATAALLPGLKTLGLEIFAAILLVLLITASGLTVWIYKSITTPIEKLRKAVKKIEQGNLDFTIESSGNDEIGELCRDFESMRKKLAESEAEKKKYDLENKELISNISHDLKTPITTVKGYVEGIIDGVADTPEKMDHYIKTIYNKAMDMDHLINELTFYSKIDTNRIPYTFSKVYVSEYFDDCAEEVCLELEERGISFTYTNQVNPDVMIIADAEQLKRVIDNIIGNSVKYMDKTEKRIDLRILDVGDFIQVELEDNGKGIDVKDLPNIFDRFYRTDASRNSSQGGSGIGLSIVRKIIEDHNGKIWASSTIGRGTTMHFVLRKL